MRISTTTIESFRLWSDPDQEWMEEGELIATIKGVFIPTPAVKRGKALHSVLETPDRYRDGHGYRCDGYWFDGVVFQPALDLFDRNGVFEAKGTKEYGPHVVVAKADQILGTGIIENKSTLSAFDFDKREASYQWRFMLDIFGASSVTYNIFQLIDDEDGTIGLKAIDSFTLYPYPELHRDCQAMLNKFVEYVERRNLAEHLQGKYVTT